MHCPYTPSQKECHRRYSFICQIMPFIGNKNTDIKPLICRNIPFVGVIGFTLVELIVTLTIAGILAAVAAPSMFGFVASNRLATQINELIADINLSRSEAIKRGTTSGICVTAVNGTACDAGGNWANGWLVYYVDPVTTTNVTIKTHEQLSGNNTLTAPADVLTFNKSGFLTSLQGDFILCDGKLHKSRVVNIKPTGRPSLTEATCS